MRIITLREDEFNDYAKKHKYESYYQTSSYAKFEQNNGYNIHYLGFQDDNNKLIGATMVIYKTLFWGYKYAYAPRGFLIEYTDQYLVTELTNALKKLLYKQDFIFIKIDPLVIASERDENGKIIHFSNTVNPILENLKNNDYEHLGFNLYNESRLSRWYAFAKLNENTRALFNSFNKEVQEKIKFGNQMAVDIFEDTTNDIKSFYHFIKKAYGKKGRSYFEKLYNAFKTEDNVKIFYAKINTNQYAQNANELYNREAEKNKGLANIIENQNNGKYDLEKVINDKIESDKIINTYKKDIILSTNLLRKYPDGIICGAALVIAQNKGVNILVNYQTEEYSRYNVTHVLTYEIMKHYSKLGYKYINLGAVTGNFDSKSKYYPALENKIGFGSSVIEYIGEFNLIINPFMYKIYKRKEKKK